MIKFEKIKPDMILYEVKKAKSIISNRKWNVWKFHVYEIDQEKRRVFGVWNWNATHWIPESVVTKYRTKNPNNAS